MQQLDGVFDSLTGDQPCWLKEEQVPTITRQPNGVTETLRVLV